MAVAPEAALGQAVSLPWAAVYSLQQMRIDSSATVAPVDVVLTFTFRLLVTAPFGFCGSAMPTAATVTSHVKYVRTNCRRRRLWSARNSCPFGNLLQQ